jgi:3-oxoadipyl-CoA thiolase
VNVYIVDACRTPVGRYRGALSGVRADDLAATVLAELLRRNQKVAPEEIEDVRFGASNQAGEDNRNVARMALLLAGLPLGIGGATVNRLCGSGLEAINGARAELMAGNGGLAIAGGVESMTRAPFVMPKPDTAFPRDQSVFDTTIGWRLVNPRMPEEHTLSMGQTAEVLAREYEIERAQQDQFALRSHQRAVAAQQAGRFADELVEVTVKRGSTETVIAADEGPRPDATLEALAKLPPVFAADGTVTAGNSSPLNDGAAACLLATEEVVARLRLEPVARIVATATAGVEPRRMGIGPVPAMHKALQRARWSLDDLEIVELNEAFAAQSLAVLQEMPVRVERLNPLGGAIALGHPIGCSGARIMTTLVHQLKHTPRGTRAAATMCIGVGQGIATLVERA